MFKSIRTRLLILMVTANALMVIGILTLNALQFSKSFTHYIIQQETRRLEPLVEGIANRYETEQNWDWLRWDNPKWLQVMRLSFAPPDVRNIERKPEQNMPSERRSPRNLIDDLAVKDAQTDRFLIGRKNSDKERIWLPVQDTNGQLIAEVGFSPRGRRNSEFDNVFRAKQNRGVIFIGFFGFLIAAALAVPFSAWLVRPIEKLTHAVRQMASGDLSVSVDEERSDELGQLATDFNRLAKVLAKNQQDRQQWVSDIAHELRTPVAIFLADIEAAQDGVRQVDDKWLAMLRGQVERLSRLVNDLHQLSQSDAGTLNYRFEPLDLNRLLNMLSERFERPLGEAHVQAEFKVSSEPVMIRGDDTRLNQLLDNLMQNTLRYTDSSEQNPGRLQVSLSKDSHSATLIWQDSSPGVGDNDLHRLFERLYRVDESRSRDSGGAGLGLTIVENIVKAHEGNIRALHSELGGVKIIINLPLDSI